MNDVIFNRVSGMALSSMLKTAYWQAAADVYGDKRKRADDLDNFVKETMQEFVNRGIIS